jgi:hypothetical protein
VAIEGCAQFFFWQGGISEREEGMIHGSGNGYGKNEETFGHWDTVVDAFSDMGALSWEHGSS